MCQPQRMTKAVYAHSGPCLAFRHTHSCCEGLAVYTVHCPAFSRFSVARNSNFVRSVIVQPRIFWYAFFLVSDKFHWIISLFSGSGARGCTPWQRCLQNVKSQDRDETERPRDRNVPCFPNSRDRYAYPQDRETETFKTDTTSLLRDVTKISRFPRLSANSRFIDICHASCSFCQKLSRWFCCCPWSPVER